jgi:hypothetical protein
MNVDVIHNEVFSDNINLVIEIGNHCFHFVSETYSFPTKMSVSASIIPNILRLGISDLKDLIRLRNVSSDYADGVDLRIDDVWQRIITRETLIESAEVNFIPIIEKYSQLKSYVNIIPSLLTALKLGHMDFFKKAWQVSNAPLKLIIVLACRYGRTDLVADLLGRDPSLINVKFVMNKSQSSGTNIYLEESEFLAMWNSIDTGSIPVLAKQYKKDESPVISPYVDMESKFGLYSESNLMMMACRSGNEDLVQLLEDADLPLISRVEHGNSYYTTFEMALMAGSKPLMRLIYYERMIRDASLDFVHNGQMSGVSSEMRDYYNRFLTPGSFVLFEPEIDELVQDEYDMFDELAKDIGPGNPFAVIKAIFIFGNKQYYPIADKLFPVGFPKVLFMPTHDFFGFLNQRSSGGQLFVETRPHFKAMYDKIRTVYVNR